MRAPIALFVYNRPKHTRETVESLRKNKYAAESDLIIFSDGAKNDNASAAVEEVRSYLRTVDGFRSVRIVESPVNKGLARSIIEGVREVLRQYDTIIVLEDDMITSPYFLSYMNQGLELYQNDDKVISIHAYIYPIKKAGLPQTFFVRGAHCWGWATWRRGWDLYQEDGQKLLDELTQRGLTREFDYNGNYPFTKMLSDQIQGLNDSWAIRWHAAAFLRDKVTLYPKDSLVRNIGFDAAGTNSAATDSVYDTDISYEDIQLAKIPVEEEKQYRKRMIDFFGKIKASIPQRIVRKLRKIAGRFLPLSSTK